MKTLIRCIVWIGLLLTMSGCGGGGGDGGGAAAVHDSPAQKPATAVIKLSTQGVLTDGAAISGIGITVNLPAGVIVATDESGMVASDVVAGSGQTAGKFTILTPEYEAATDMSGGKLSFVLASTEQAGFGTGEFASVTCKITADASPAATDFTLSGLRPVDLKGVTISGLSATHTVELK